MAERVVRRVSIGEAVGDIDALMRQLGGEDGRIVLAELRRFLDRKPTWPRGLDPNSYPSFAAVEPEEGRYNSSDYVRGAVSKYTNDAFVRAFLPDALMAQTPQWGKLDLFFGSARDLGFHTDPTREELHAEIVRLGYHLCPPRAIFSVIAWFEKPESGHVKRKRFNIAMEPEYVGGFSGGYCLAVNWEETATSLKRSISSYVAGPDDLVDREQIWVWCRPARQK